MIEKQLPKTIDKNILNEYNSCRNRISQIENQLSTSKSLLNFKTENFFCLGSPLGVYLT